MGGDSNTVHLVTADGVEILAAAIEGRGRARAGRAHRRRAGAEPNSETRSRSASCGCRTPPTCRCRPTRASSPPGSISSPRCRPMRRSTIAPGERAAIPTGLAIALPPGTEGQVRPRSGLALAARRHRAQCARHHRCRLSRRNTGHSCQFWQRTHFQFERGMRIAQLVVAATLQAMICEVANLDETTRGAGGFGSTGTGRERAVE